MQKIFLCMVLFFMFAGVTSSQSNLVDSLQNELNLKLQDTTRIRVLNTLIYNLMLRGKFETAESYINEIKKLGTKYSDKKIQARILSYEGLLVFNKGNSDSAIVQGLKAVDIYNEIQDWSGLADVYSNLGMFYMQKGASNYALESMNKALNYYAALNDKKKLVIILNNMGDIQFRLDNYEQAYNYFYSSLSMAKEINYRSIFPYLYINLGDYYKVKNRYNEALNFFYKALNMCEEVKNKNVFSSANFKIGMVQIAVYNYQKAIGHFSSSLQTRKEIGDSIGIIAVYNQIAYVNLYLKKYSETSSALETAMKMNTPVKDKGEMKNSCLYYSMLDSAKGNYASALKWYKKYSELKESLFAEAKGKEMGRLEAKFEYEKKEEQFLESQKKRNAEIESKLTRKNSLIYLFAGAFVLMMVIVAAIIKTKKDKQKANEKLIKMVEERTSELRVAKEKAEASERIKDEFLSQMSHEIRTPLNSVISLTGILLDEIKGLKEENILSVVQGIDKSGKRIIRTIEMLLNYSEVINGTYKPKVMDVDLKEICGDVIKEIKPLVKEKGLYIKFHSGVDNKTIEGDEYSIHQIIKNIIENAVIYTEKGGVDVSLIEKEGEIIFNCRDTGIGISDEFKTKIFQPFNQEETGYTRKYEGNGLGLALSKKYCELNGAVIECESEKGIGSEIIVRFS